MRERFALSIDLKSLTLNQDILKIKKFKEYIFSITIARTQALRLVFNLVFCALPALLRKDHGAGQKGPLRAKTRFNFF